MASGIAQAEGQDGYQVPVEYLERYADLLVNFALGGGSGSGPARWSR